jgi:hypothetical protein
MPNMRVCFRDVKVSCGHYKKGASCKGVISFSQILRHFFIILSGCLNFLNTQQTQYGEKSVWKVEWRDRGKNTKYGPV